MKRTKKDWNLVTLFTLASKHTNLLPTLAFSVNFFHRYKTQKKRQRPKMTQDINQETWTHIKWVSLLVCFIRSAVIGRLRQRRQ
jgi:hypothetical protein